MNQQKNTTIYDNQPQITTQPLNCSKQLHQKQKNKTDDYTSESHSHQDCHNCQSHGHSQPLINDIKTQAKNTIQFINQLKKKHPQCIPVFFVKHEAAAKDFPSPKIPFILFRKQLKIQQAMYALYNQIQIKGLYFFCTRYNIKQKRMKYVILKPGQTIQEIYKKYGKDGYLSLIYGDKNIGMGSANAVQKWLIRLLILLGIVWVLIYSYPLYMIYQSGGIGAVWSAVSGGYNKNRHTQLNYTNSQDTYDNNDLGYQEKQQQHKSNDAQNYTDNWNENQKSATEDPQIPVQQNNDMQSSL